MKVNFPESMLDEINLPFDLFRIAIIANKFSLDHPEYNFLFPFDISQALVGLTPEKFLEKLKKLPRTNHKNIDELKIGYKKKELEKKAEDLLKSGGEFEKINIREKESFMKLLEYCYIMEFIFEKPEWGKTGSSLSDFFYLSIEFIRKYYELIGYWTAKIEKRRKNPGAVAMKKRGEKNTKVIDDILKDLRIENTSIFRKDKKLREIFFSMAKEKTDCTSEDRILKIARSRVSFKLRHCLDG
jgi:hypothetical protein